VTAKDAAMTGTTTASSATAESFMLRLEAIVGQPLARRGILADVVRSMAETETRAEVLEAVMGECSYAE
jgi:hypothetical protein